MPRYFFHLRDDRFTPDEAGEDFETPQAATREALRIVAGVLRDLTPDSPGGSVLGLVCTDAGDSVVCAVRVSRPSRQSARRMLEHWRAEGLSGSSGR